jgi:hypothetical protein
LSGVNVLSFKAEVSASDRSLVQRSPTECRVSSECDLEASKGEAMARNSFEALHEKSILGYKRSVPAEFLKTVDGTAGFRLYAV